MPVWIAGDCKFFESGKRDSVIKDYWNQNITDDDDVLITGEFIKNNIYNKDTISTIQKLNQDLKGKKIIIDYDKERHGAREALLEMNFLSAYKIYAFVPDRIYTVHILPDKDTVDEFVGKMWGAAPRSLTGFSKVFEHNILSLSIDDWGQSPILYTEIPKLVENMIMFNEIVEGG